MLTPTICWMVCTLVFFVANLVVHGFHLPNNFSKLVPRRVVGVSLASSLPLAIQEDSADGKQNDIASYSPITASSAKTAFDAAVLNRYACKQFQRYDGLTNDNKVTSESASPADPTVVQQALQCLDLARRSPTGFNTQPYKIILVQSAEQKTALAKYCSGPNAQRVRDSDCTAVFLADREVLRTLPQFLALSKRKETTPPPASTPTLTLGARLKKLRLPFYIALFSSGYPLPRFLAAPISLVFRFFFYLLSLVARNPLPTLSSSETWSIKNTMLVAMTYMLACTSRGIQTSPMEGFSAWGIRKVLKIPRRYAIPLIVSTGRTYQAPTPTSSSANNEKSDKGTGIKPVVEHRINTTPRYPMDQVVFQDAFSSSSP